MQTTPDASPPQRFALILVLSLTTVLWTIAMPQSDATRAVSVLLQGLTFVVALIAARDHRRARRTAGLASLVVLAAAVVLAGLGVLDNDVRVSISLAIAVATPAVMARGLVRLLRERGVVAQAVFGALAFYLQIGLVFAYAAAVLGRAQGNFFTTSKTDTISDFVYWSFTTMSTTGYGDFVPATQAGHSLAVFVMLIGQIYLVTVVALLIGNMGTRRSADA